MLCNADGTSKYGDHATGGLASGTMFALSPGEKVHAYIDSSAVTPKCSGAAKGVEADINITYTKQGGITMRQIGSKKYVFKCSG
jgi:hypothetical protein